MHTMAIRDRIAAAFQSRLFIAAFTAVVVLAAGSTLAAAQDGGVNNAEGVNGTATIVIDGADRYDTAAQIALGVNGDYDAVQVLYIANGETLVDAMAIGVSHDGAEAMLLVRRDEIPAPTREALQQIRHAKLVFLGGDEVISPAVRDEVASLTCNYATSETACRDA